ncbi:MAG TPA: hypothetical protein VII91_00400 [Bauldia sp.]
MVADTGDLIRIAGDEVVGPVYNVAGAEDGVVRASVADRDAVAEHAVVAAGAGVVVGADLRRQRWSEDRLQ